MFAGDGEGVSTKLLCLRPSVLTGVIMGDTASGMGARVRLFKPRVCGLGVYDGVGRLGAEAMGLSDNGRRTRFAGLRREGPGDGEVKDNSGASAFIVMSASTSQAGSSQ